MSVSNIAGETMNPSSSLNTKGKHHFRAPLNRIIHSYITNPNPILFEIGQQKHLKFKIKLTKGACSTEPNISICRINVDDSEEDNLEFLRSAIAKKFKSYYVTKDNFDLYWQDEEGDFVLISDNDDLSLALEEMTGQLYEVFACFKEQNAKGKSSMLNELSFR